MRKWTKRFTRRTTTQVTPWSLADGRRRQIDSRPRISPWFETDTRQSFPTVGIVRNGSIGSSRRSRAGGCRRRRRRRPIAAEGESSEECTVGVSAPEGGRRPCTWCRPRRRRTPWRSSTRHRPDTSAEKPILWTLHKLVFTKILLAFTSFVILLSYETFLHVLTEKFY